MQKILQEETNIKDLVLIEKVKNERKGKMKAIIKNIFKFFIIALFPLVLFFSLELLNGMNTETLNSATIIFIKNSSWKMFFSELVKYIQMIYGFYFWNKIIDFLIIIGIFLGIYSLTGKRNLSMILTSVFTMSLAIVNYFLVEIRGTPITPADFYSLGMINEMKNSIDLNISALIFISIGIVSLWIFICSKIKFSVVNKKRKRNIRIISLICCLTIFVVFFMTNLLKIEITYDTKGFYEQNGICGSFFTILKEMIPKKPDGYSIEAINEGLKNIEINDNNSVLKNNKEKPNIIVIMNESFADLSEVYNIKLTEDNMPFIHSMNENTIKANVHSSSLGGKTSNCEWEFLTGNTTKFLPVGAVPYQQYIKEETHTLASILNSQGYNTSAFHPYNPDGYYRNVVYPLLGFKDCKFNDSLKDLNMLRFDFADDLSTYKNIIDLFESKNKDDKLFNFTVTIQNHTSYFDDSFENKITLSNYDKDKYTEINQYLSLIKLSDDAFKYLIDYFEDFDEPTIIMMFGDHQPGFVTNYEEVLGIGEQYDEKQYIVPMVLWANYDIKEYNIDDISMNYLSNILFNVAGLDKSKYMNYLENMYKKYPVITTNTYKDINGKFYNYENIPEDFKLYEYIQYNNMFDRKNLIEQGNFYNSK